MGLFDNNEDEEANHNEDKDANSHGGFEAPKKLSASPGEFARAIDEEAGVVLYAYSSMNGYTLTAVPLKDTELEQE